MKLLEGKLVFMFCFCCHPHAKTFFLLRIRLHLKNGIVLQEDLVQREDKALKSQFAVLGFELALPHLDDVPTHTAELEAFGKVALAVTLDLGLPEVGARLGKNEVSATLVAVPEATVHEDDGTILAKHDVRCAGQAADVDTKTESLGKQIFTHQDLGLGVSAADAGHAFVPLFGCQLVCHAMIRFSTEHKLTEFSSSLSPV